MAVEKRLAEVRVEIKDATRPQEISDEWYRVGRDGVTGIRLTDDGLDVDYTLSARHYAHVTIPARRIETITYTTETEMTDAMREETIKDELVGVRALLRADHVAKTVYLLCLLGCVIWTAWLVVVGVSTAWNAVGLITDGVLLAMTCILLYLVCQRARRHELRAAGIGREMQFWGISPESLFADDELEED